MPVKDTSSIGVSDCKSFSNIQNQNEEKKHTIESNALLSSEKSPAPQGIKGNRSPGTVRPKSSMVEATPASLKYSISNVSSVRKTGGANLSLAIKSSS